MEKKNISSMNIYQRLAAISAELGPVVKDMEVGSGKNAYKALRERAILEAIKPLEAKYGVYSYPTTERKATASRFGVNYTYEGEPRRMDLFKVDVTTVYRFVNIDNPEEFVETTSFGTGVDTRDKAPGKAMTYADKYALMKMYKISGKDEEDPDSEPSPEMPEDFAVDGPADEPGAAPVGAVAGEPASAPPVVEDTADQAPAEPPAEENSQVTLDIPPADPKPKTSKPAGAKAPASGKTAAPAPAAAPGVQMTLEQARQVILPFGQFAGTSMGEVLAQSPSMVEFYAGPKFTNNKYPELKTAAQLLLANR